MAKAKKGAAAKKSSTKGSKKPATKAVKKAAGGATKAPRAKKAVLPSYGEVMTTEERRKMLKLRADSDDVAEQAVAIWGTRRDIRVSGLTPAKLRALMVKAKNAEHNEAFKRSLFEAKLRPLQDARLRAEDAAYRALLDLHAQVKVLGRNDPTVIEAFAFLAEHVGGSRAKEEKPEDEEKEGG